LSRHGQIELLCNHTNVGVAAGFNQAIKSALDQKTRYIVLFDQDSQPNPLMIDDLLEVFSSSGEENRLALVAPVIEEAGSGKRMRYLQEWMGVFFKRTSCKGKDVLRNVVMVLSSGSLLDLSVVDKIGLFREDFFIDYVDTEYCLRLLSMHYEIAVACGATLPHRLGSRREIIWGGIRFYPTYHSPIRWYYISRNRIPMLRMYALKFPHWLSFEIVSSVYIFFRMLLFEDHRLKKLEAIIYGTLDGLRGRMGKIRPEIESKLRI
jgi:rhamnosyltransferase